MEGKQARKRKKSIELYIYMRMPILQHKGCYSNVFVRMYLDFHTVGLAFRWRMAVLVNVVQHHHGPPVGHMSAGRLPFRLSLRYLPTLASLVTASKNARYLNTLPKYQEVGQILTSTFP